MILYTCTGPDTSLGRAEMIVIASCSFTSFILGIAFSGCVCALLCWIQKKHILNLSNKQKEIELSENKAYDTIPFKFPERL